MIELNSNAPDPDSRLAAGGDADHGRAGPRVLRERSHLPTVVALLAGVRWPACLLLFQRAAEQIDRSDPDSRAGRRPSTSGTGSTFPRPLPRPRRRRAAADATDAAADVLPVGVAISTSTSPCGPIR